MKKYLIVLISCALLIGPIGAKSYSLIKDPAALQALQGICYQRVSDTATGLWLTESNRMALGRPFEDAGVLPDDENISLDFPYDFNASYPAGSSSEYLYAAGLWVGGIKGNDTLVSHAFDYVAPIPELLPGSCPDGAIRFQSDIADIEYIYSATDTALAFDTLYRCYFGDCRDWYPLGISVTAHSYRWVSPPYDNMTIVAYTVKNIDTLPLEQGWVGIYADCDIGSRDSITVADDVSGFIDGAVDGKGSWVDLNLGYSMDMDGDPGLSGFTSHSTTGAFGVQVLGLSSPDHRVNFNWWTDSETETLKTAPRRNEASLRDLGGSFAIAYGDSNKYYLMSHEELDYNQVEAGFDHPGWLDQKASGTAAAEGGDTRFLISAGPFDLAPGDSVVFSVAYMAADDIIRNAYVDLWFLPYSPLSVADYYEVLDFTHLTQTAVLARTIAEQGLSFPPPGPPENFSLAAFDDTSATVVWNKKNGSDIAGYALFASINGDSWQNILDLTSPLDTVAVIGDLLMDSVYEFAVSSRDAGESVGSMSSAVRLPVGAPHPPEVLMVSGRQAFPVLNWSRSIDLDVDFYRLYRASEGQTTRLIIETSDTAYIDYATQNGSAYFYYVSAVDDIGRESIPSQVATVVPMPMTSGILAINQNPGDVLSNTAFDDSFFADLIAEGLADYSVTYKIWTAAEPVNLKVLSDYSLVIVSAENRGGSLNSDFEKTLDDYLGNGGRVVLLLRYAAASRGSATEPQIIKYGSRSIFSKRLHLDSAYIGPTIVTPGYHIIGDLIGAIPSDNSYPHLAWDSVRVNSFGYSIPSGLPYCGYVWPGEGVDVFYSYESFNTDSTTHMQANGIKYTGDDYGIYLLNFPLSLMQRDSATAVLRAIIQDLGQENLCGDINKDYRVNIGDVAAYIRYLYFDAEPPGIESNGDIDCDGELGMPDVLRLINYFMSSGLAPACCE